MQMENMSLRLDEQTRHALEAAAQRDSRKPAALARLLISEGLRRRGILVVAHGDDRRIAGGERSGA
jgi:hypothetical protein